MTNRCWILWIAAPMIAMSACEASERDAAEDEHPIETTVPEFTEAEACTNPDDGYSVAYPAGWHTNEEGEIPPCSVFDPEPFELPSRTEIPLDLAIRMRVESVTYEQTIGPAPGEEEIESDEVVVDGRTGERIEVRATGDGYLPEDAREYRYHVGLEGRTRTFIAATNDANGLDYEQKKEILDDMMGRMRFEPSEGEETD